ncbi:MAG: cytochrome c1 [Pseudomonadota bacterium]
MKLRALICVLLCAASTAWAENALKDVDLDSSPAALRRGAVTVTSRCLSCHSVKYLHYRDLLKLDFSREEVMSMGNLESALLALTPAEVSEQAYGRVPPDLSLLAKAREGGPRYIYTLLTGFYQDQTGEINNHLYPGIRMPDILGWSGADSTQRAALAIQANEAAAFLMWAADPRADERKSLGYYTIAYLALLTGLLYLVKRKVWARLK